MIKRQHEDVLQVLERQVRKKAIVLGQMQRYHSMIQCGS